MRGLFSKRKIVVGALLLLFLFSLNFAPLQARGVATAVSSPFLAALWQAGDNVSTFFAGGGLQQQNQQLEQENAKLRAEIIALQETASEAAELRQILGLELQEDFSLRMAEIVAKNIGEDTVVIRAGKEQGIAQAMPVITSSNVAVGRVTEVFAKHAVVQLLSSEKSSVDAQIANTQIAGLIRGQGGQEVMLDLVPQEESFFVGDTVVTSNLGEVFPENLLVGEVREILKTGAEPFQKAVVESFFNLQLAELVFVITSL